MDRPALDFPPGLALEVLVDGAVILAEEVFPREQNEGSVLYSFGKYNGRIDVQADIVLDREGCRVDLFLEPFLRKPMTLSRPGSWSHSWRLKSAGRPDVVVLLRLPAAPDDTGLVQRVQAEVSKRLPGVLGW